MAPEKIENVLVQSLYIAQTFVYGDSLQSSLVAIVIPDEEPLRSFLKSRKSSLADASLATICQPGSETARMLKPFFMQEIKRVSKENGLHGFEVPKEIHIDHEPFSAENGLLTPTFKLKRAQARDKYEKEIELMYASMPPPPSKL